MGTTLSSLRQSNSERKTSDNKSSGSLRPSESPGADRPDANASLECVKETNDSAESEQGVKTKESMTVTTGDEQDGENIARDTWTNQIEFFLSCFGYAVGLGNVWRFPMIAFENGGGAFFIPYFIMLFFMGMPIFFLEMTLGQFTSCGPATCWEFALLFQGIGLAMCLVSFMIAVYYNIIIAWSLYYFAISFTDVLPWEECVRDWASSSCGKQFKDTNNCQNYGYHDTKNGICRDNTTKQFVATVDKKLACEKGFSTKTISEEYFFRGVLGMKGDTSWDNIGTPQWHLVLCLLALWIGVALTLIRGIKTSGKVVYFTATFPYVVLLILFIFGLTLDGHKDGIAFYITPTFDKILEPLVWIRAAQQIFFSLSSGMGGLVALSSYNHFHHDHMIDTFAVCIGNCLSSVFAGFVVFSYMGFLAKALNTDVSCVAKGGPSLAFIVYPTAIAKLPVSPLWAILFFLMFLTLGYDTEFVLVETVLTSLLDLFPDLRKRKAYVVTGCCALCFLLGLPMCCNEGIQLLDIVDTFASKYNFLIIALFECIGICYVYGLKRFLKDIEFMLGKKFCGCMHWSRWKYWWAVCWVAVAPVSVLFLIIFDLSHYKGIEDIPLWVDILIVLILISGPVAIFGTMILRFYLSSGSFKERLRYLTKPTRLWGPALMEHRKPYSRYMKDSGVKHKEVDVSVNRTSTHSSDRKRTMLSNGGSLIRTL